MFPRFNNNSGIKHRAPFISKAGTGGGFSSSNTSNNRYKPTSILYCKSCGFRMVYVESFHAYYCNECGASEDPVPEELSQVLEQEKQSREAIFSTADGSPIYNSSNFSHDEGRRRRHSTLGGRTINMKGTIEDKLRPKSYTEKIFEQETRMLERSGGNTITSQHTEIRKSPDIISSCDLIASKGNVGIRRSSSNEKRRRQSHDIL
jgi:hypothetical protein